MIKMKDFKEQYALDVFCYDFFSIVHISKCRKNYTNLVGCIENNFFLLNKLHRNRIDFVDN